jgi:hypothetical protein
VSLQITFELPPNVVATRTVDGDQRVVGNDGKQADGLNRFVDGETDHSLYADRDDDALRELAAAVADVEWEPRLADEYHFTGPEDLAAVKRLFASHANAGASMRSSF